MGVYSAGSVTVTSGSTVVSGQNTAWQGEIDVNDVFMRRAGGVSFKVASVDSDLQLQLSSNYPGPTASGVNYDIFQDFTPIAGLAKVYGSDRTDWAVILGDNFDKLDNHGEGWNLLPFTCTFATASGFTVTGDKTSMFPASVRVKVIHAGGTSYLTVDSSTYNGGTGKTTIVTTSGGMQTPISSVHRSVVTLGSAGNFPNEWSSLNVSGNIVAGSIDVSGFATISGIKIKDEDGSHSLQILPSGLTADRILVIDPDNVNATLHIPVRTSEVKFAVTDVLLGRQTAGAGLGELIPLTAAGRSVISGANTAVQKTTLGLGTGDSPTFAGATIGSLAGFLFGTAGVMSAVGSGNKALVVGSVPIVLSNAGPYTISVTDTVILNSYGSDTSVNLPALGTGRILFFINRAAGSIQSYASSNVVLIGGGAPQGTICAAGAGNWSILISDSSAWQVIAGN